MDKADRAARLMFEVMQGQTFADWYKEFILWVEGDDNCKSEVELKALLAQQLRAPYRDLANV